MWYNHARMAKQEEELGGSIQVSYGTMNELDWWIQSESASNGSANTYIITIALNCCVIIDEDFI